MFLNNKKYIILSHHQGVCESDVTNQYTDFSPIEYKFYNNTPTTRAVSVTLLILDDARLSKHLQLILRGGETERRS